jgi:hypothetical protein
MLTAAVGSEVAVGKRENPGWGVPLAEVCEQAASNSIKRINWIQRIGFIRFLMIFTFCMRLSNLFAAQDSG